MNHWHCVRMHAVTTVNVALATIREMSHPGRRKRQCVSCGEQHPPPTGNPNELYRFLLTIMSCVFFWSGF